MSSKKKGFDAYDMLNGMVALIIVVAILLPGVYLYQKYMLPLQEKQEKEALARQASKREKFEKMKAEAEKTKIVDGIHVATGLIADDDYQLVVSNCISCHSSKLITQNRATKAGWQNMIRWMQETQNLWDLGENEEKIVAYLAKNYAPEFKGRRTALENIAWYDLEEEAKP